MQELSLNILDIAQNSVRANASLIEIIIEEQPSQDLLSIDIIDNGCGMTAEQLKSVTDPFFTTRTTRKVGLGVPFLKMAAEMSGGSLTIDSTVGVGTKLRTVFGLTHIDRMPLGDISATMCSLIQCNTHIDFVYTYKYGSAVFVADTRAFKEVLEGLPLDTPQVISYIGEYINEGMAETKPSE